jgi:hypothetical protein
LQACLEHAEVIIGEPKGSTLELLAAAPNLRWFQARDDCMTDCMLIASLIS